MDYFKKTRSESHRATGRSLNWFTGALFCRALALTLLTTSAWVCGDAQVMVGYVANSQDGTISLLAVNTIKQQNGPIAPPYFATALNSDAPLVINVGKNSPVRVAATPAGDLAFVSNQANNTISVIDTVTNVVFTPVITVPPIGSGPAPQPRGIAVLQKGSTLLLFVANQGDNSVSVFDVTAFRQTNQATEVARLTNKIGPAPIEIVGSPDNSQAFILNNGTGAAGSVTVLDATVIPPTVVAPSPITVGNNPTGIAISSDGSLVYVTNRGSNSISGIAPFNLSPTPTNIANVTDPVGVAFVHGSLAAFVTNSSAGQVTEIDHTGAPQTPLALHPPNSHPSQIAISTDGTTAFITDPVSGQVLTVQSVDHSNGNPAAGSPPRLTVGNGAAGITLVESAPNPPVCGVGVTGSGNAFNGAGVCVPNTQDLAMVFETNPQGGPNNFACGGAGPNGDASPGSFCSDTGVVGGGEDFTGTPAFAPGIYTVIVCTNGGTPPTCGGGPSARQAIAVPALTSPAITCSAPTFTSTTTPPSRAVQASSNCFDSAQGLNNFTNPAIPLRIQMKLDWNDGTAPVTTAPAALLPTPGNAISGNHNYVAATQQTVTVTAIDNILSFANPVSTSMTVKSAPPTCAPSATVKGFVVQLLPNCTDDDPVPQPVSKIVIDWDAPIASTTQTGMSVNQEADSPMYPTTSTPTPYMIKVTATDSSQPPNTASFTVPVTVPSFTPQGPVCNFPSAPVPNGLSASVAVMCTAVTGDSIASVTVTFDVANSVSTTVQPSANTVTYGNTFTHTYPLGGTYNLTVSATDITGLASATPGTATVTVSAPQPPTCTLTVQGTGGLSVAALGTCQDQVSPISDLTVNFGDDTVAHGTGGALKVSQTFAHTYAVAGTYNVTLTGTNSIPLTSASVSQSISVPSPVAISGPSQASVSAGGTVTYTVTLPLGFPDPNPPLTLSCAPNPPDTQLPAGIQCLFTPAKIAPGQSSTLTVATNASPLNALRVPSLSGLELALLPAILLIGSTARRRKTGAGRLVAVCLAMSLTLFLAACGTNTPAVQSNVATPPGTYTVLVQVTDATNRVVGSNAVTLTVK